MGKNDLGIDLGTANFLVYQKGKGIVLYQPSVVAISKKTGKIIAIGDEAKEMIGKTPEESIIAVRPMKDGVIADYTIISEVLRMFIKRVTIGFFLKPNMVIGIPAKTTTVEKRAVFDAAISAGAKKVYVVSEPLAAAIGAGIDVTKPEGNIIVDIGGGTTDIAVISLGGVVVGDSVKLAGDAMDDMIIKSVRKLLGLIIGESTAEEIKKRIGKAHPEVEDFEMEVKGRDAVTGLPRTDKLNSFDVYKILKPILENLIARIKVVLEKTPPELSADIMEKGIVITGGGALLRGIDKAIYDEIGVPCKIAEDPLTCVARGTGILLEDEELLNEVAVTYE
ncbi:rod shape-determining protein MreB [Thermosipho melanesiensis]|uniref:Cell shape-determining protein MreB n=2 Tax=Thermosipho melanesiensis TaxID=46541 RepID=A6LK80_THEM4|nr:rod shape-determining protein [Thermosipho melanesiensis]ABR30331.1 cell shape determining protein, MreB/Mrl family [Thermosipho melanesiensis BI429]APT73497.1 rod shape-determining protein MreB [Thermosipho melanesiensis]OOC37447.1 rod shape-determining protein MreB [Thermosipho melanesiensis]OOC39809.1 rod shape-determining protein MreB [Thermosipho melanesiensis]OOC39914.1 rod shape-determining protein MreB [Thermosipho melanesiensis]